jgi:hypothetical protein
VDDGILVNVSTGYRVHEMVLEKQSDSGDTYRVTDWEPLEASLVGIPADPTVGVGRSAPRSNRSNESWFPRRNRKPSEPFRSRRNPPNQRRQ